MKHALNCQVCLGRWWWEIILINILISIWLYF